MTAAARWTEHQLISFDETPLFYRSFQGQTPSKGIVIIIHGMGEHGGRYHLLAEYLVELGFTCVVPDLRGFGRSGGERAYVNRFADFHEDLKALHAFIARNHKDAPIFLSAVQSGVDYFITGNLKDFKRNRKKKIGGITVLTPKEAVESLRLYSQTLGRVSK